MKRRSVTNDSRVVFRTWRFLHTCPNRQGTPGGVYHGSRVMLSTKPRCAVMIMWYCPLYTDPKPRQSSRDIPRIAQRPYFWNSQSLLSRGHTWRAFSHLEMQWKWKACYRRDMLLALVPGSFCLAVGWWSCTLHMPQATVHSSLVAEA